MSKKNRPPRTKLRPLDATTLPELSDDQLHRVSGALTAYMGDSGGSTWTWTYPTDPDGLITKDDS